MSLVVAILHSGKEPEIIRLLESSFKFVGSKVTFEVLSIKTGQQVETIVSLGLNDFKERKMNIIIIISLAFLENIWVTAHKTSILNNILNYPSENILHIWAEDVDEEKMRMFSTHLCQKHLGFRRMLVTELKGLSSKEVVEKVEYKLFEERFVTNFSTYSLQDKDVSIWQPQKSTLKLNRIGFINIHNIALKLNEGSWKKVALRLDIDKSMLQSLDKEMFPAERLLEYIGQINPYFSIGNLIDLLQEIKLPDIVKHIQKVVL